MSVWLFRAEKTFLLDNNIIIIFSVRKKLKKKGEEVENPISLCVASLRLSEVCLTSRSRLRQMKDCKLNFYHARKRLKNISTFILPLGFPLYCDPTLTDSLTRASCQIPWMLIVRLHISGVYRLSDEKEVQIRWNLWKGTFMHDVLCNLKT